MRRSFVFLFVLLASPLAALAEDEGQFFPAPEFRSGHQMPQLVTSPSHWAGWPYVDTAILAACLGIASYLVYYRRTRRGVFVLMVFALVYFGFFRNGCICPIGSIQNVALAAGPNGYALPITVALFFILPLIFALFFGRVFCSSVCPLGAIQDVVLWKPVTVPSWLEHALGLFAYVYLGLAVMLAYLNSDFVICRYDPFVGFFRLNGPRHMLIIGGIILLISMFVGRTYCRFICPYSVLLKFLSPFSRRRVTITPDECVDCRLCETSCPFGAIRHPTPSQPPRRNRAGRRQLAAAVIALPLLVALFAAIGYYSGPLLSRNDFTVRLAERIWIEENGKIDPARDGVSNESVAFREKSGSVPELYQVGRDVRNRFAVGATAFGAFIGAVIGWKLVGLLIRRRRTGYTADPAWCVACARCYTSCPVELEHKQKAQAELVTA